MVEAQINKLLSTKKENKIVDKQLPDIKDTIAFEEFAKLDIRVVTVLEAERMKKSKKMLKLSVDTGKGIKTVLSGVSEYYTPEALIGKQVTMLINLAPRKMMGIESEGMILMAEDLDGTLRIVGPDQSTNPGSIIN